MCETEFTSYVKVGDREGVYAGFRISQTLTSCSKCVSKGPYY